MVRRPASLFVTVMLLTSMVILPGTPGPTAQAAAPRFETPRMTQFEIPPATLRTMDEMLADEATLDLSRIPGGSRMIPFRTSMDPDTYVAAKRAAGASPQAPQRAAPAAPGPAQATVMLNCDGEDQTLAGGGYPPDADGAFGYSTTAHTLEFVQVTNQHVTVWDAPRAFFMGCSTPTAKLLDVHLNSFFGYVTQAIFDPRVVHDDTYKRWVISAEAFPEASGAQFQFIAVSISDDARGPYFMYRFDTIPFTCGVCFWDFPQLGIDDQAVILTANVFNPTVFIFPRWVFMNKQHLYYGLGLFSCVTSDGGQNLISWAPPKVLDLHPRTWMIEAPPTGNVLHLAAIAATGQICPIVISYTTVAVSAYIFPPNAPQPGTTQMLDTIDARFQNRSTQIGNALWNVHSIDGGGRSQPVVRRIDITLPNAPAVQSAGFFTSATSSDFNPSVAANSGAPGVSAGSVIAVTWSSTDAPAGRNAQVRTGRCVSASGVICSPGAGILVFQSGTPLVGNPDPSTPGVQRWGDYSFAAIDGSGSFTGGVNEEITNPHDSTGNSWGTRYFVASFP